MSHYILDTNAIPQGNIACALMHRTAYRCIVLHFTVLLRDMQLLSTVPL